MSKTYKILVSFFAHNRSFNPKQDPAPVPAFKLGGDRVIPSLLKAGFIEEVGIEVDAEVEDAGSEGSEERVQGFFRFPSESLKDLTLEMMNVRISETAIERNKALSIDDDSPEGAAPVFKSKKDAIAYLGKDL